MTTRALTVTLAAFLLLGLAAFALYRGCRPAPVVEVTGGVETVKPRPPLAGGERSSAPIPSFDSSGVAEERAPADASTAGVLAVRRDPPADTPATDNTGEEGARSRERREDVRIRIDRVSPAFPFFRRYDGSVRLTRLGSAGEGDVRYAPRPHPFLGWQPRRVSIGVQPLPEVAAYAGAFPLRVWGFELGGVAVANPALDVDLGPAVEVEVLDRLRVGAHYLTASQVIGVRVGYRIGS